MCITEDCSKVLVLYLTGGRLALVSDSSFGRRLVLKGGFGSESNGRHAGFSASFQYLQEVGFHFRFQFWPEAGSTCGFGSTGMWFRFFKIYNLSFKHPLTQN